MYSEDNQSINGSTMRVVSFFYIENTLTLTSEGRKVHKKNSDVIKIREEEKRNRKETLHPLKKWIIHHFYDVTC